MFARTIFFSITLCCIFLNTVSETPSHANSIDLKSLSDSRLKLNEPMDASYFAIRCSALAAAQYRVMDDDPPLQNIAKRLHELFFIAAIQSKLLVEKKEQDRLPKKLAKDVLLITNIYSDMMELTYKETGSYFDGNPLIEQDTKDCSSAAQQLER